MPFVSQAYQDYNGGEQRRALRLTHLDLGYHPETGDDLLIPETNRYAGTYVLGVQGTGKSGFLEGLIHQDAMCGNAIIVLDPHGDLVAHVLAALPPHRLPQTYLLDMEDEAYPFGVNVFATGKLDTSAAQTQAVDRLMHIFEVLWPEVVAQQHLPRYVRTATIALLANPGATLVDMQKLLDDSAARAKLLRSVTDPTVRQFWRMQYDELSDNERSKRVQPLVNRLELLFVGRPLVSNIVGQRATTIDFRRAIENREIILIRLPIKTLPQDARLIGTLLMSQIQAALFSFVDTPEQQRPGFSLFVDEFQHFATPDFNEMFSEGRKFGVKVTLAHQYRGQLPDFLQESTMTARTKVCFQTTPEDGRAMSHFFPSTETIIKPEDIDHHVSETLRTRASDYGPEVERFVDLFLQPLQRHRKGRGRVEITNTGFYARGAIADVMSGGETVGQPIIVDDPTDYLDRLLYDVMKTGNPDLPIPWEIPRGFSNGGKGFFGASRAAKEWELSTEMMQKFPPHLVVPTADGDIEWARPPESGKETFYFFIFCLRSVMYRLAAEPIGKATTTTMQDVGKMLSSLPRRAVFVRSGDDVGVIYTRDMPEQTRSGELNERLTFVRNQTRAKYCRSREDIEQALLVEEDEAAPTSRIAKDVPYSGWEEA